jgi:cobalamin-dependent methionine synthase I
VTSKTKLTPFGYYSQILQGGTLQLHPSELVVNKQKQTKKHRKRPQHHTVKTHKANKTQSKQNTKQTKHANKTHKASKTRKQNTQNLFLLLLWLVCFVAVRPFDIQWSLQGNYLGQTVVACC